MTYREQLEDKGMIFAGLSPDGLLPETIEMAEPSLVHRRAISSRAEIAAVRAASAVCELHCRGDRAEPACVARSVTRSVDPQGAVTIGQGGTAVSFAADVPFALIAGPCAMESRAHALETAQALKEIAAHLNLPLVFKASFDKANRTSASSARGLGFKEALPVFAEIREIAWACCHDRRA